MENIYVILIIVGILAVLGFSPKVRTNMANRWKELTPDKERTKITAILELVFKDNTLDEVESLIDALQEDLVLELQKRHSYHNVQAEMHTAQALGAEVLIKKIKKHV